MPFAIPKYFSLICVNGFFLISNLIVSESAMCGFQKWVPQVNIDALLASVFQGNMNYCPKCGDGVRGLHIVFFGGVFNGKLKFTNKDLPKTPIRPSEGIAHQFFGMMTAFTDTSLFK